MNKQGLIDAAIRFTRSSEENIISDPVALSESVKGLVIFDDPIFSFARAYDDLFSTLKKPAVIGEHFLLPHEWLEGAKTVISFFLPFSEAVRTSNSRRAPGHRMAGSMKDRRAGFSEEYVPETTG
jgi:hypothetical protein